MRIIPPNDSFFNRSFRTLAVLGTIVVVPAISLVVLSMGRPAQPRSGGDHHSSTADASRQKDIVQSFTELYVESDDALAFTARFMGMRIMQNPADMWAIQEIVADVHPDLIIETGTAYGGSSLYYATILTAVNPRGRVITIDIDPRVEQEIARISPPILQARVREIFDESVDVVESNSIDPKLIEQLAEETRDKTVMVVLDSCHHSAHVLKELQLYSPLVSHGSYLIAQDTIIDRKQEWIDRYAQCGGYESDAGPAKAVQVFLAENDAFEADRSRERYLLTFCPGGFLRRK